MDEEKLQQAKNDAFNLLSYRERSCYELKQRLFKKGYQESTIEQVISRLTELDYLDDYRFATNWVKDRIKNNPRGRIRLRYELKEKGISNNLISRVLTELINDKLELEITAKLAQKWLRKNHGKENEKIKLKKYLQYKGIKFSIINKYVNRNM